jgi:hypothetical protein
MDNEKARKTAFIKADLAQARRRGQTYNEMHAEERESGYKKGALSKAAYDAGRAYELYSPAEVRKEVDSWPQMSTKKQYLNEKAAGGPLTDISYEEWKALD